MRRLPIDHCPSCGVRALGNTYCARCEVDMVDANGLSRIEPSPDEAASAPRPRDLAIYLTFGWTVAWVRRFTELLGHPQWRRMLIVHLIGFVQWAILAYVVWLGFAFRRHLRLHRPWWRGTSIAAAQGERARIRGQVTTLVPASVPTADDSLAVEVRRTVRWSGPTTLGEWFERLYRQDFAWRWFGTLCRRDVVDTSVGGRFAIRDATGVAVVDDDALEVFDARPFWVRWSNPLERVEDGDDVEVMGPARRATAADACILGGAPAEHARTALVFDGRPDAKVRVLVRGRARATTARPAAHANAGANDGGRDPRKERLVIATALAATPTRIVAPAPIAATAHAGKVG